MYSKLAAFFSSLVIPFLKKYAVGFILRTLGLVGGVWGWIVQEILLVIWGKIQTYIAERAAVQDQKVVDDANIKKYQDDKKAGADEKTKIKDELDLLNGTDTKH